MDHMQILKRAWRILWSYRVLWIFGILLALTASSGYSGGGGGGRNTPNAPSNPGGFHITPPANFQQAMQQLQQELNRVFSPEMQSTLIGIGIAIACLVLLLIVALSIVHYVSQVSMVRMVDGYEATGEKVSFRQGWRLGWSRAAWRLFLINLVIFVPLFVVFIVLFGLAALPVLLSILTGHNDPGAVSIIGTVGLAFLAVFILIVISVVLSLLMEVIYRTAILRNLGVFDAIREGWRLVRRNLKDVFLMWLILVGIRFGYTIAMIPVVLLLLGVGLLVGGGVGAGLFLLVKATATVTAGWVTAGVVGGLIFLLIFILPLTFLGGLYHTYTSSTWTLTYRAITQPPVSTVAPSPEPSSPTPLPA